MLNTYNPYKVAAQASKSMSATRVWTIHSCFYTGVSVKDGHQSRRPTNNSFGVGLASGSLSKQLFTNPTASGGNFSSGVKRGASSLTICCKSSRMLIVMPPPCKLTPLLFRLSFLDVTLLRTEPGAGRAIDPGLAGDSVLSKSESSSSSEESAKGKRPRASSIREMPRDQTSDFTVYCAPWMRSGYLLSSLGLGYRRRRVNYSRSCTWKFRQRYLRSN